MEKVRTVGELIAFLQELPDGWQLGRCVAHSDVLVASIGELGSTGHRHTRLEVELTGPKQEVRPRE